MSFVIDASVTATWCFPDEAHPAADIALERLENEGAVAPAHWWFEIRNVLLTAERRARISESQRVRFLRLLDTLPIITDRAPDETATYSLAHRHGLSFYDAAYLELARREGPLATLDRKLLTACRAEGVAVVGE